MNNHVKRLTLLLSTLLLPSCMMVGKNHSLVTDSIRAANTLYKNCMVLGEQRDGHGRKTIQIDDRQYACEQEATDCSSRESRGIQGRLYKRIGHCAMKIHCDEKWVTWPFSGVCDLPQVRIDAQKIIHGN